MWIWGATVVAAHRRWIVEVQHPRVFERMLDIECGDGWIGKEAQHRGLGIIQLQARAQNHKISLTTAQTAANGRLFNNKHDTVRLLIIDDTACQQVKLTSSVVVVSSWAVVAVVVDMITATVSSAIASVL